MNGSRIGTARQAPITPFGPGMGQLYEGAQATGLFFCSEVTTGYIKSMQVVSTFLGTHPYSHAVAWEIF